MSTINKSTLVALAMALSCCHFDSLNTALLPAPANQPRPWPAELGGGQVVVGTLQTSEPIPSPRWLAIDSKDTLYATVGNNRDSILYAVDLGTGQVKKYKSSAYNRETVKESRQPSPAYTGPNNIITPVMPEGIQAVEGIEIWQKSPVVAVDAQDQVYVLLPYSLEPFYQAGPYTQVNRITFAELSDFWNPGYIKVISGDQIEASTSHTTPYGKAFAINAKGEMYFSDPSSVFKLKNRQVSVIPMESPLFLDDPSKNKDFLFMHRTASITEDSQGNLFVTQGAFNSFGGGAVYQISPSGLGKVLNGSSSWWGHSLTAEEAVALNFRLLPAEERFSNPTGIVTDKEGAVYVADSGHHRIRKIWPDENRLETLAGDREAGFVDAEGQTARFSNPIGMAWDSKGNLYIADSGNDAIRVIAPIVGDNGATTTGDSIERPQHNQLSGED